MTAPVSSTADRSSFGRVRAALGDRITSDHDGQIYGRCPLTGNHSNNDRSGSLSVTWKIDPVKGGRTWVYCHRECDLDDVLDALGLTRSDLYDTPPAAPADPTATPRRRPARPRRSAKPAAPVAPVAPAPAAPRKRRSAADIESEHPYTTDDGQVIYTVVRWKPTSDGPKFSVRTYGPSGRYRSQAPAADRRVLYQLPTLAQARAADAGPVYLTEGERDADSVSAAGGIATTAAFGAPAVPRSGDYDGTKKWQPQYTAQLADLDVVVVMDADGPAKRYAGERWALYRAQQLAGTARSVVLARPAAGLNDVSDHLEAGHRLADLALVDPQALADEIAAFDQTAAAAAPAPAGPPAIAPADEDQADDAGNVIQLSTRRPTEQPRPGGPGGGGGSGDVKPRVIVRRDEFATHDGALFKITRERGTDEDKRPREIHTELANAVPRLIRRVRPDLGDGDPLRVSLYDIEVTQTDHDPMTLEGLDQKEWESAVWARETPLPCLINDTANGRATLRKAILATSGPVPVETRYGRLGWWQIDGEWVYIHAGGAITSSGATDRYQIGVSRKYQPFTMAAPAANREQLRRAVQAALIDPMDCGAPGRLIAPMLAAAWRAVLGYSRVCIVPCGKPGSGKTALAAIGQQHFAPSATFEHLPFGAGEQAATVNSLEEHRYIVGDMLQILDDLAPDGGLEAMGKRQNAIARSQAERRGKDRRTREMGMRAEHPPNGLVGITTEQWTGIDSAETRTVALESRQGEVDPKAAYAPLDEGDGPELRSMFAATMAMHYADRMPMDKWIRDKRRGYQDELISPSADPGVEARRSESFADLAVGARAALDMCVARGALTQEDADAWWARLWAGIKEAKTAMTAASDERRPREILLELLRTALARKRIALEARHTGSRPVTDAELFGYERLDTDGPGANAWRRVGDLCGWVDDEHVFLLPSAATEALSREARGAGIGWKYTQTSLGATLADEQITRHYIERKSGARRTSVGVRIGPGKPGTLHRVWEIDRALLFGDDDQTDPGDGGPGPDDPTPQDDPTPAPAVDPLEAFATCTPDTLQKMTDDQLADIYGSLLAAPETALASPAGQALEAAFTAEFDRRDATKAPTEQQPQKPAETATGGPAAPAAAIDLDAALDAGQEAAQPADTTTSSASWRAYDGLALVATTGHGWLARTTGTPTRHDLPALPDGPAALPALCDWLEPRTDEVPIADRPLWLGHNPNRRGARHSYGQLWILPPLRAALGLPNYLPDDPESRTHQTVADLLAAGGWEIASRGIAAWTTIYRPGGRRLSLVVPEWLSADARTVFGEQDPDVDPETLARRLGMYASLTGIPHQWAPATTGVQLITKTRPRIYQQPRPDLPAPLRRANGEQDYLWQRPAQPDELAKPFVMMIDKRAAHLGSSSSSYLGYGAPTHYEHGEVTFDLARDRDRVGSWRISTEGMTFHSRLPDPLRVPGRESDRKTVWVTTPTLRSLALHEIEKIDVREAYLWPAKCGKCTPQDRCDDCAATERILEPWYKALREPVMVIEAVRMLPPNQRAAAFRSMKLKGMDAQLLRHLETLPENDEDADRLAAALKGNYAGAIGRLDAKAIRNTDHRLWRPDWRQHILAQTRYAMTRAMVRAADHHLYPLAVLTDAIVYAVDDPDPAKALPADVFRFGWGLGNWHMSGVIPMNEVRHLLNHSGTPKRTMTNERGKVTEYGLSDTIKGKHRGGDQ